MNSLQDEWNDFINNDFTFEKIIDKHNNREIEEVKCSDIYISTKTKIAFLNQEIDLNTLFWELPVIDYYYPVEGIVKKQIKITTFNKEESEVINELVKKQKNCTQRTLSMLDNPKSNKEIKYKHVQAINIGLSKKDIMTHKIKKKQAFYNSFALTIRLFINDEFKEFHIKVFNTGKLEIPGIQTDNLLYKILDKLIELLQPYVKDKLDYNKNNIDTVLINSNFNCGYYVNRHKLFLKLKKNYGLITMYDPCSYPGIQSKFYYNKNKKIQNGICECSKTCNKKGSGNGDGDCMEISFMIFRTGSILIVGKCNENVLYEIYYFIRNILEKEYNYINNGKIVQQDKKEIKKNKKIRKKGIIVSI